MIASPHLGTTLLYDVSRWWSLYLNRCVTESSFEDVGASVVTVPFLLDPILLKLEGGWYVVRLLPVPLVELVSGRCGGGGGSGSRGGGGGGPEGEERDMDSEVEAEAIAAAEAEAEIEEGVEAWVRVAPAVEVD